MLFPKPADAAKKANLPAGKFFRHFLNLSSLRFFR